MSGGLDALALKEDDVSKFLVAGTHLGSSNVDFQMENYVYKRRADGTYIINLRRTWEKVLLAARAIAAIENPADVCVISARPYGQRAVLKFASYVGATPIAGRYTPGTFTNQIQSAFREPRLLVVTDPRIDHQPVTEASYVNIPVIALCNTDSPLRYVDICIPSNNKSRESVGLMWWMLSREVLRLRGTISREQPWEVMVDLFFYRDPEEVEKEEQAAVEPKAAKDESQYGTQENWSSEINAPTATEVTDWSKAGKPAALSGPPAVEDWSKAGKPAITGPPAVEDWAKGPKPGALQPEVGDWAAQEAVAVPIQPAFGAPSEEWSATDTGDWSAPAPAAAAPVAPAPTNEWGGPVQENWS